MARPNLSYLRNLFLFLFGLPVGILTGLTAIGGSVVLIPAARWLLGLRPTRAAGTALAVTAMAALAALLSYAQHGDVRVGLAVVLTLGQIVGAGWGTRLAERAPGLARLPLLWALLVLALGLTLAAQGRHVLPGKVWDGLPFALDPSGPTFYLVALAVAALVGLVSRVMELGGVLLVPAAVELLHLPPHLAAGTALVTLLLAALPGMVIYARRGELEPTATVWLAVGGVFGSLYGAWAAHAYFPSEDAALTLYGLALTLLGLALLARREQPSPPA